MTEAIDNSIKGKNQRRTARGNYTRWLANRFGFIDLMSTKELEDKVSLSKIYVPLRLSQTDIDENDDSLTKIDQQDEQHLGDDARKVIVEQDFIAVSGRPGSGKTTLTQALIGQICNENGSDFADELAKKQLGEKLTPIPVPLILRDYQGQLANMNSFEEIGKTRSCLKNKICISPCP